MTWKPKPKPTKLMAYNDPGHGWLRVPMAMLHWLGIADKISAYSYQSRPPVGMKLSKWAYLEEHCDMPKFLMAAKEKGIELTISDQYTNNCSGIRSLPNFNQEGV